MRHLDFLRAVSVLALVACAGCAPNDKGDDTTGTPTAFESRIRARKDAAARGDSVAWLAAAGLHERATCTDANGRLRSCRPDFGSPAEWQLRSAIESLQVNLIDDIALVTYRQTDTVIVGTGTLRNSFRYVETYRRATDGWQLLQLSEAPIPAERIRIADDPDRNARFTGTYASGSYAMHVTSNGAQLLIATTGEAADTLFPMSPARFFARGDPGEYEFVQEGRGPARELHYLLGGQVLRFPRR